MTSADGDAAAFVRKRGGDGAAEALAGGSYECDFAGEAEVHGNLLGRV